MLRWRDNWRHGALFVVAMIVTVVIIGWLSGPFATLLGAAGDVRDWIVGLGPLAPLAYVLFYMVQILIAPVPGNLAATVAGYTFGFGYGLFLSLVGLAIGATLAVLIGRYFGRPLLERFFDHAELIRWERKLQLRSPLPWFVLFMFPVPDLAIYVAGMGALPLRWLLPAILLGRGIGILSSTTMGHATAVLPAQWVLTQWLALGIVAVLTFRFQRPMRYHLLVSLRRTRRAMRTFFRPPLQAPAD